MSRMPRANGCQTPALLPSCNPSPLYRKMTIKVERITPSTLPSPPVMLTPPSTAMVIACRLSPSPTFGVALALNAVCTTAAIPANSPAAA